MDVDQDPVMPTTGGKDDRYSNGVVVPKEDGEASRLNEREALAQVPMAPVNGPAEGTAAGDALMEEIEDVKEQQNGDADEEEDDDDLFGDGADDDEDGQKPKQDDDDEAPAVDEDGEELTEAELERRRRLEYEEDDAPVVETKVQYAQVRLPKIPMASQTQKLYHAKLPNFLHLDATPFNPMTYDPDEQPSNIPVENTLRWRWKSDDPSDPSAPSYKQTNARVIKWNDGSMSLQLGGEIFDIATDRTATGKSVAPPSAPGASNQDSADSSTYLVAQHPYANLLETQALVTGNLTFRPTTIQSTSHRKIASSFAAQQVRKSKTVMIQAANDPEAQKAALERNAKLAKKPRAARGEGSGAARKSGGRRSIRSSNLADWSDGDALTDEDVDAAGDKARVADRRARRDRDKAEMNDFLASESDEDGEEDDEDEDEETSQRRERRKQRDDEMDVADDLDEMEAQAERAARAERNKKKKEKVGAPSATAASAPVEDLDSDDLDKSGDERVVRKKLVIESDEE